MGNGLAIRAIASNIVRYRAVWISTQRLRGSENGNGKNFFCFGNGNGERDRERLEAEKFCFVALCFSLPF